MKQLTLCLFAICLLLVSSLTTAHDARPLSITLLEQSAGIYRVVVRAPPSLNISEAPLLQWPENCDIRETAPLSAALGSVSLIVCADGLAGKTIALTYPSFNPSITALIRLQAVDGHSITAVLPPDTLLWTVPVDPGWSEVALEYTILGFKHIWLGIDHLLFVLGLLLLARRPRKILYAITGFTIAHSITLSLATLGVVRVPITLVEAMIALSVFFLAVEIARGNTQSFSHRFPIVISFVFGLLHGFGFASVLGEFHLPEREIVTGLLFFNVGVELGQIAFIAVLLGIFALWQKWVKRWTAIVVGSAAYPIDAQINIASYLLGIPAAYWFIERTILAVWV